MLTVRLPKFARLPTESYLLLPMKCKTVHLVQGCRNDAEQSKLPTIILRMVCRFDTGTLRSFQEYKLQQAAKKAAQSRSASTLLSSLRSCFPTITPAVAAAHHIGHYCPKSAVNDMSIITKAACFSQQFLYRPVFDRYVGSVTGWLFVAAKQRHEKGQVTASAMPNAATGYTALATAFPFTCPS